MKNQLIFAFTLFLTISLGCKAPKTINKAITHEYKNLVFTPNKIQKSGFGKMEITIAPIDARSLNKESFEASGRDGNYEKELAIEIEKTQHEFETLSKSEKAFLNGRIKGIETVNKLEKDGLMAASTANDLKYRIWYGKEFGKDGTEISSISDINIYPDDYNPYKINQKYLSVFKVTFENNGNQIEEISLKQFQIISGEELLFPLSIDYFENNLKNESEKIKNVYRMNMPATIIITPSQRITKYIAIPALNPRNQNLKIQLIKESAIINYDFQVNEENIIKKHNLKNYEIVAKGLDDIQSTYYYYYAVSYDNGITFATKDEYLFIDEEKKNHLLSIYIIAIQSPGSKAKFAIKNNFRLSEIEKNKIIVPFDTSNKKNKKR